jgi:UDP-N-acetylmuramoylalanine--D-glutamate ligase
VLAASAIATTAGIGIEPIKDIVTSFTGVEHRLELVRELNGRSYYNDAIATSPERALAAVKAFQQPLVLLVGGKSKHLAVEELAEAIVERVRYLIVMGEFGQELLTAVRAVPGHTRLAIAEATSLEAAVQKAAEISQPGDAIVLSPGGTSFDWFRDFEDRGRQYKVLVMRLPGNPV